jgi:hypothetical protein
MLLGNPHIKISVRILLFEYRKSCTYSHSGSNGNDGRILASNRNELISEHTVVALVIKRGRSYTMEALG